MNLVLPLFTALLFVVLTPGVLLTLPKGGSKLTVAVVHGLVFAVAYYFIEKIVSDLNTKVDGFKGMTSAERKKLEAKKKMVSKLGR
jgi:uncharacterized membrane protein